MLKDYSRFLSNIDNKHKGAIIQAAKDTGFSIEINDNATMSDGTPYPSCFAVFTNEPSRDHTEFWNRYKELKK